MKIVSVVGARPNFMKIAPFIRAIEKHNKKNSDNFIDHLLVHTGQHYDARMSDSFFSDLGIPAPDINMGIGSGSHAEQVGKTMIKFEKILRKEKPDWVVVVGDVNATLACSVTAKKENIKCCHIESGLRSGDMTMPEEVNRLVTDRLSDLLLVPDAISMNNLRAEGVEEPRMVMVGNIMIDTLDANFKQAKKLKILDIISDNFNKESFIGDMKEFDRNDQFALITLHRPSNVDEKESLTALTNFFIEKITKEMKILWPMHPRTEKNLKNFNLWEAVSSNRSIFILHPTSYHETLKLNSMARIVLTDSGGLQEECTVLGTPCLTLRNNTERPVTLIEHNGASVLVGNDVEKIEREFLKMLLMDRNPFRPPLWDGHTAERCVKEIVKATSALKKQAKN
jgi:UDP-N-acetylglucosamine 2-epimerase (non-hydrolysing)